MKPNTRIIIVGIGSMFLFFASITCHAISETVPADFHPLLSLISHTTTTKLFFYLVLFAIVIYSEMWFPVNKMQRVFSVGFMQDAVWYAFNAVFYMSLMGFYISGLEWIYNRYLAFLTIESVTDWHPAVRALTAIAVADFLRWVSHLLRHKVSVFWPFHSIHHAQQELNMFTDLRLHPFDRLISSTLKFTPLLMFDNAFPVIFAYAVFHRCYTMFYHGNIKTNFGILRYILVTPQSHRIHHSQEERHRDTNFATIFSVWDHLFGTQYRHYDEYPETGITDSTFPCETNTKGWALVITLWQQLAYPFRAFSQKYRSYSRP